jgi:hypothetical protein
MEFFLKCIKRLKREKKESIPKQNDIIKINNYHYDMSNKADRSNLLFMLCLQKRTN